MFVGDSADICAGQFPLVSMGGRAEGLACADPGARTPIGASGNFVISFNVCINDDQFSKRKLKPNQILKLPAFQEFFVCHSSC